MRKLIWKALSAFMLALTLVLLFFSPGYSANSGSHLITNIQPFGQVKYKRPNWQSYKTAFIGKFLNSNDRLLLSANASAVVLCRNRKVWQVPKGRESTIYQGCGVTDSDSVPENEGTLNTRVVNKPDVPYLIYPRDTSILETQPTLRWNAVPGVSRYEVKIIGTGWQTSTSETEVKYPGEPPLQPGFRYWLVVEAESGESSSSERDLGFTILPESEKDQILSARDELQQKQLTETAEVVALADLYQSNDLKGAAINLLEEAISNDIETVAIYQLLGKVYQQVGLNSLAKARYLEGLKLAEQVEDIEGQAEIQGRLAIMNAILGDREEAQQQLENSQSLYQELGDLEKARQLEEEFIKVQTI